MTITKFRELYKDRATPIKLDSITLTEHCHKKAFERNAKISKLNSEPLCIVRENESGAYDLIVGYRDYITAKNNGAEEIRAIIVPDKSRTSFLKSLDMTFEIYEVEKIHPPKGWTSPVAEKIQTCKKAYELTGVFGKSVMISPEGTILDGYAAVCAARLLGVEKIPVYILAMWRWKKISKNRKKKI